jgi:hypothetical protein
MKEVGCELFQKLFDRSDVWQSVRQRLSDTRIEIETELEDALVPGNCCAIRCAGQTRYNAAALARAGRFPDAHEWAQSALRDYQASENADQYIVETLKLLEWIESALRATSPPSAAHPPPPR